MEIINILQFILIILTLFSTIYSYLKQRDERARYDQKMASTIENMLLEIDNMKKIVGNGGVGGLRKDIETIKIHCAAEMAKLETAYTAINDEIKAVKNKL